MSTRSEASVQEVQAAIATHATTLSAEVEAGVLRSFQPLRDALAAKEARLAAAYERPDLRTLCAAEELNTQLEAELLACLEQHKRLAAQAATSSGPNQLDVASQAAVHALTTKQRAHHAKLLHMQWVEARYLQLEEERVGIAREEAHAMAAAMCDMLSTQVPEICSTTIPESACMLRGIWQDGDDEDDYGRLPAPKAPAQYQSSHHQLRNAVLGPGRLSVDEGARKLEAMVAAAADAARKAKERAEEAAAAEAAAPWARRQGEAAAPARASSAPAAVVASGRTARAKRPRWSPKHIGEDADEAEPAYVPPPSKTARGGGSGGAASGSGNEPRIERDWMERCVCCSLSSLLACALLATRFRLAAPHGLHSQRPGSVAPNTR
jgi:hypothetical protein